MRCWKVGSMTKISMKFACSNLCTCGNTWYVYTRPHMQKIPWVVVEQQPFLEECVLFQVRCCDSVAPFSCFTQLQTRHCSKHTNHSRKSLPPVARRCQRYCSFFHLHTRTVTKISQCTFTFVTQLVRVFGNACVGTNMRFTNIGWQTVTTNTGTLTTSLWE
jgi:hypothetical protein